MIQINCLKLPLELCTELLKHEIALAIFFNLSFLDERVIAVGHTQKKKRERERERKEILVRSDIPILFFHNITLGQSE
jgi:hypothetical protein